MTDGPGNFHPNSRPIGTANFKNQIIADHVDQARRADLWLLATLNKVNRLYTDRARAYSESNALNT